MPSAYRYPDHRDLMMKAYIEASDPYPGYWIRSESYAWRRARRVLAHSAHDRLLDFGCGTGRLLRPFAPLFHTTTAIEPDPERANDARRLISEFGLSNVKVLIGDVVMLEQGVEPFDAIICSHVLQHVATADVPRILTAFRTTLKHDGLLVLCVPLGWRGEQTRLAVRAHDGQLTSRFLAQEEFDSLAINGISELPVRLFNQTELDTLLMPGFRVLKRWMHCDLRSAHWLDQLIFRDHLINFPIVQGRFGNNILLIARRAAG